MTKYNKFIILIKKFIMKMGWLFVYPAAHKLKSPGGYIKHFVNTCIFAQFCQ